VCTAIVSLYMYCVYYIGIHFLIKWLDDEDDIRFDVLPAESIRTNNGGASDLEEGMKAEAEHEGRYYDIKILTKGDFIKYNATYSHCLCVFFILFLMALPTQLLLV